MEAEVLEFRSYEDANAGLALIRDGNATRSFDTLMRYRSAAMAEFWRALKTLKALQAEQAEEHAAGAQVLEMAPKQPRAPARLASRPAPNEPCLADVWHEVGRPPRARGGRAGSEIGTNPGSLSPSLSMIPPRCSSEPERLVGTSP